MNVFQQGFIDEIEKKAKESPTFSDRVKSSLKHGAGEAALIGSFPAAIGGKIGLVAKHYADSGKTFSGQLKKSAPGMVPMLGEYAKKGDDFIKSIKGMSAAKAVARGAATPYKHGFLKPSHSLAAVGLMAAPGLIKGMITG